ncbi:hypothetical protein ACFOSC_13955 [Streptantibioticus rubrisoli]|uniref:Integral membrane protein n=1 Tax=Streptantibioticus rubrisoli TaxID=1387313 RepID=A0ABT1PFH5_9ACTN|nr:hypothetical protein [Streptantibioticus rubrisoli]MCQ4042973.1 hypothetical protein [Streptantibioticus rubrisoli]
MTAPVRAGADLRLLRAAVFAAVCVTLSAAGHAMASGGGIPLWALLAGWVGVLAVAAPLAGRERSLPAIAAAMLGGQLALHALFSTGQWCAEPVTGTRSDRIMALAGHLLCNDQLLRLTPASAEHLLRQAHIDPSTAPTLPQKMPGMTGMPGMPVGYGCLSYSLPMLCGHLAAALVTGWLLRRGEAALWRLVQLSGHGVRQAAALLPLRAALFAVRTLALVAGLLAERLTGVRRRRTAYDCGHPESVLLQHSVIRRGPPAVALAA